MRERVSSLRSMGLGIRSELSADTDAEAAGAFSHSTLKAPANSVNKVRTVLAPPQSQRRLVIT